jgi:hypothetical protein
MFNSRAPNRQIKDAAIIFKLSLLVFCLTRFEYFRVICINSTIKIIMPKKKSLIDKQLDKKLEKELNAEEFQRNPPLVSPTEGIAVMKDRLDELRKREKHIRTGDHFKDEALREECLIRITREIRDAQSQLKEYKTQLEGRN